MNKIFRFGEKVDEYDFKVLNERDIRAGAGIMFLFGTISLFFFIVTRNIFWAELFTITFIIEFIVRIFINPIYAPYMMLGSLSVSNQSPEWVEARPKKFAWVLALLLGAIMGYFIIFNVVTPLRLLICLICLILLFLESSFGICLGCLIYKRINIKLYKCAGDTCEIVNKKSNKNKYLSLMAFIFLFYGVFQVLKIKYHNTTTSNLTQAQKDNMEFEDMEEDDTEELTNKDCQPPQFVVYMGKEETWLERNGCK